MDLTTLRAIAPEFRDVEPDVLQAAIDRAARFVAASVWGARQDDGIALLAAHYLTISPMGGATRLASPEGSSATSTYKDQFDELAAIVSCGSFLVAGGC